MKTVALIASLLLSGTAVAAESSAENTADAGNKKKDKLICRNQTPTGSRLGSTRVCMTESQWADFRRQTRTDIEKRQTMRGTGGS
jgi:hypothetical protein